jgi:hypothetical protein
VTKVSKRQDISDCINLARTRAVNAFLGQPVTPKVLKQLAQRVYLNILEDVARGLWRRIGVVDPDDFVDLKVVAHVSPLLARYVQLTYDFSRTKHPYLVVSAEDA